MAGQFETGAFAAGYGMADTPVAAITVPTIGSAERGLRLGAEGPAVFLHNVGTSYDDLSRITGIGLYSGRVLCATRPGDVIHLPEELAGDFAVVREHYERVGLDVAKKVLWTMSHDPSQYPDYPRSDFLFDESAMAATPNMRRLEAVQRFNDKNWFIRLMQSGGFPIPETTTHEKGEMPKQAFDGPWYVKGAVAASGTQVIRCETWDEVLAAADSYSRTHAYQVQADARTNVFLNVQYSAHDGKAEFVATTTQVLHGFEHNGNRFPSEHDPRDLTDPVAQLAAAAGIEGMFAFDVAAGSGNQKGRDLFVECNPRANGSSYFTATAEREGADTWMGVNVPTTKSLAESVTILHDSGIAFDPTTGEGATVVNWGTAPEGKLGVLFVGPREVQDTHYSRALELLAA